jgi:predicted Rossmann fold flavoprotein
MSQYDIIVIGGGPAGVFAALVAAEANPDLKILILEKGRKPLSKVRISGGGRCNLTHACYDTAELVTYYPRGGKELRGPFTRFNPGDTVSWFEGRGVKVKTEADGRIFPVTDRSETIVDCLVGGVEQSGIELRTGRGVNKIMRIDNGFVLAGSGLGGLTTAKVLVATGGGPLNHYDLAANLGHEIIPPVPSLFTLNIQDPRLKGLAGVSIPEVEIKLLPVSSGKDKPITSRGPVLVTHWGLSGPAVLGLSAWGARRLVDAGYRANIQVNWLPKYAEEDLMNIFQEARTSFPRKRVTKNPPHRFLPARLWEKLVHAAGIGSEQPWSQVSNQTLRSLADQLIRGEYNIQGKGVYKEEFVTCGGVSLKEVDFKTMQSWICSGLYFAGEVLDIDGLTGGFNFQAAWTTGWLAGQAMAGKGN